MASTWGDSLVTIDFHVQATASVGLSTITLASNNNAGPTTTQVQDSANLAYTLNSNVNGSVNVLPGTAPAAGDWTAAPAQNGTLAGVSPPTLAGTGTMLLLSDGTVLAQANNGNPDMFLLSPDSNGDYSQGKWTTETSMITPRLYYGSVVLKDGRVLVVGGEYSGPSGANNWTNVGEIFDASQPVGSQWKSITAVSTTPTQFTASPPAPPPTSQFGDGEMELLNDGKVLAGWPEGPNSYIYDFTQDPLLNPSVPPGTNPWTADAASLPATDSITTKKVG